MKNHLPSQALNAHVHNDGNKTYTCSPLKISTKTEQFVFIAGETQNKMILKFQSIAVKHHLINIYSPIIRPAVAIGHVK